ncbi:MAG: hypothetical protein HY763_02020 [Planctomycetes bacterium]|nr:hypothetical protein [Planctomycetota bacterium]
MRIRWRRVAAAIGVLLCLYLLWAWYQDAGSVMVTLLPRRWQDSHDPEDVSILLIVFLLVLFASVWKSGDRP